MGTCPRRHPRRQRDASALVELGLCAPFLLMLFAAAIEYGFMIYDASELVDAARDGARLAARCQDDAKVTARVQAYFPLRNITNPVISIQEYDSAGVLLPSGSRVPGSSVKVSVTCGVQWLTPIQALWGGNAYGLGSSSTYRVENP